MEDNVIKNFKFIDKTLEKYMINLYKYVENEFKKDNDAINQNVLDLNFIEDDIDDYDDIDDITKEELKAASIEFDKEQTYLSNDIDYEIADNTALYGGKEDSILEYEDTEKEAIFHIINKFVFSETNMSIFKRNIILHLVYYNIYFYTQRKNKRRVKELKNILKKDYEEIFIEIESDYALMTDLIFNYYENYAKMFYSIDVKSNNAYLKDITLHDSLFETEVYDLMTIFDLFYKDYIAYSEANDIDYTEVINNMTHLFNGYSESFPYPNIHFKNMKVFKTLLPFYIQKLFSDSYYYLNLMQDNFGLSEDECDLLSYINLHFDERLKITHLHLSSKHLIELINNRFKVIDLGENLRKLHDQNENDYADLIKYVTHPACWQGYNKTRKKD